MNLIETVAELKKYRERNPNDVWITETGEYRYAVDMLNAAPAMLDILGEVQPGDADEIDYAIQELSRIFGPDDVAETVEVLRRYQAMASKMCEERK